MVGDRIGHETDLSSEDAVKFLALSVELKAAMEKLSDSTDKTIGISFCFLDFEQQMRDMMDQLQADGFVETWRVEQGRIVMFPGERRLTRDSS